MSSTPAIAPAFYNEFHCVGAACEDSCCLGWLVTLDKKTFHFYKQNQHKALRQRFADSVKRNKNSTDANFGIIKMDSSGRCPFLDTDSLCAIQKNLGAEALSETCAAYPRRRNIAGARYEYSMSLSCPEVARLALLNKEPMRFVPVAADPAFKGLPELAPLSDEQRLLTGFHDSLRALVIAVLQARELSIDERLILLGLVLYDFEAAKIDTATLTPQHVERLEHNRGLLGALASIRQEFGRITPDPVLQVNIVTEMIKGVLPHISDKGFIDHLLKMAKALDFGAQGAATTVEYLARHDRVYRELYAPFFAEHGHILENYLVQHVFHTLFPLTAGTLTEHYRSLLGNYLMLRTLLLGQAQSHGALNEQIVRRTIQSFVRFTGHSAKYKEAVQAVLEGHKLLTIPQFFPLLVRQPIAA